MKTRKFTFIIFILSINMLSNAQFLAPSGGWNYIYTGDKANTSEQAGLDGTFEISRSSFKWDYTLPGQGAPGGAGIITENGVTFLRMQDTGDPRDYGLLNTENGLANEKLGFIHCVSHGGLDSTSAILDNGITFAFRARIPTSGVDSIYTDGGQGRLKYPENGDGYKVDQSGYAPISIVQVVDGVKKQIGFTFLTAFDIDTISLFGGAGLYMNLLNGTEPAKEVGMPVDIGPTTTVNKINLDPTQWHEFWIQISPGGEGTHKVKIWKDGDDTSSEIFDVTAGRQSFRNWSGIFMALKNTDESGAIDIDYFAYKSGLVDPVAIPSSVQDPNSMITRNLKTYPNPFSNQTSIEFKVEKAGPATLSVYNTLGQKVQTLINEEMHSGTHTMLWSANDLSEGLYLLELNINGQREIKRIVLQR